MWNSLLAPPDRIGEIGPPPPPLLGDLLRLLSRLRLRLLSRDRDLLLSLDLLRLYLSRERLLLYLSLLRLLLLSLSRDRLLLSRDFRSLSLSRLRSRLLFRSLLFRSSLSRLRRESPLSTSLACNTTTDTLWSGRRESHWTYEPWCQIYPVRIIHRLGVLLPGLCRPADTRLLTRCSKLWWDCIRRQSVNTIPLKSYRQHNQRPLLSQTLPSTGFKGP